MLFRSSVPSRKSSRRSGPWRQRVPSPGWTMESECRGSRSALSFFRHHRRWERALSIRQRRPFVKKKRRNERFSRLRAVSRRRLRLPLKGASSEVAFPQIRNGCGPDGGVLSTGGRPGARFGFSRHPSARTRLFADQARTVPDALAETRAESSGACRRGPRRRAQARRRKIGRAHV